jgi:hypothetical protein
MNLSARYYTVAAINEIRVTFSRHHRTFASVSDTHRQMTLRAAKGPISAKAGVRILGGM